MEDGFFLRKKPLGSTDSVNARIENAITADSLQLPIVHRLLPTACCLL
jgi:hypothetical protein